MLGRDPENSDVVQKHVDECSSLEELIDRFLNSDEFLAKRAQIPKYRANPLKIEYDINTEKMSELFIRTSRQWTHLGETEPYWSVLTSDLFRSQNIENNKTQFDSSGQDDAALVDQFFARAGLKIPKNMHCLELGCGVGRITRYLSQKFEYVTAIDISPGNLRLAQRHLKVNEIVNVEFILVQNLEVFHQLPQFDFLYSIIVFQHNPPPVQLFMLDSLLSKIRTGGGCLFQLTTELPNYTFEVDRYLDADEGTMDMHCLPMNEVLAVIQRRGLQIREVRPDGWAGLPGSFTFFAHSKSL